MHKTISENVNNTQYTKGIIRIVLATVLILLIPLVAMQFTDEVDWQPADFVIIGTLLIGTGLVYEFIVKKIHRGSYRVIAGIILLIALLLVWAELAVGVFGTPFSGS